MTPPDKVKNAINHVKQFHPDVDRVIFWKDGRWQYCTDSHDSPKFDDNMDIDILERTNDFVHNNYDLPQAFQI